jgi:hypothetical protein
MIPGDAFMTSTARPQAPWALRLLPPFPAIAHRILALASKEDVGASELGGLIKLDPSFSAELLRFANSALFGARREVTSLSQAVARLGMDRVKSMATFVALNNMVRTSVRALALRKVWVHSVVTAIIAEEAARISCLDCEIAYTTGLLHNLGTLGLMSAYPDEYPECWRFPTISASISCRRSAISSKSTTVRPALILPWIGVSRINSRAPSPPTTMSPLPAVGRSTTSSR